MNTPHRPERNVPPTVTDHSLWLPTLTPRPSAALRLIAFPYAGGGVPVFRAWPDLLPETVELRVVQLPGRGRRFREEHFLRPEPALDALEEALLPLLDRPFVFFGHSLGALLAFETTRRLSRRGLVPAQLLVSGRIAPHLPPLTPPIHQLPPDTFLQRIKELNGMAPAILNSQDLLDIVLPVIRSDFTLLESYQYSAHVSRLSCPITVFGGDRDPQTTIDGLEAWRDQTAGGFELAILPGDHFFIDTARANLIDAITAKLIETGFVAEKGGASR